MWFLEQRRRVLLIERLFSRGEVVLITLKHTRKRTNRIVPLLIVVAALVVFMFGAAQPVAAQDSVLRLGGTVVVGEGERLVGDVVAIGGSVDVLGDVIGDVVAIGGAVAVDGSVSGDVIAVGGAIKLGPNANINGDVTAVGGSVNRNPDAVVRGEVAVVNIAQGFRYGFAGFAPFAWNWFSFPFGIVYIAGLFALALIVLAVMPDKVQAIEHHMESNAGRSILIGLLAMVLLVPLTIVLVLTIVGPLLLWLGFFGAKMLGYVALVGIVGRKVGERFSADVTPIWQVVVGVAIVAVLRYMPVFGAIFTAVATVWSVGAVLDTKFGTNRPWLPPRQS